MQNCTAHNHGHHMQPLEPLPSMMPQISEAAHLHLFQDSAYELRQGLLNKVSRTNK